MKKGSALSHVGRGLLLGVAVGALPIAGCTEYPDSLRYLTMTPVTTGEKQLYEQARASQNPELVSQFLVEYPSSRLIRNLLLSLDPAELQRISPSAVAGVDPDILASLPPSVRMQLGLSATPIRRVSQGGEDY